MGVVAELEHRVLCVQHEGSCASLAVHVRPGCSAPTFDGKPGHYCSFKCRDAGHPPAMPPVPNPAREEESLREKPTWMASAPAEARSLNRGGDGQSLTGLDELQSEPKRAHRNRTQGFFVSQKRKLQISKNAEKAQ
eukprot:2608257-Amphidinium_carterae.1